jgi:hypothetical protein
MGRASEYRIRKGCNKKIESSANDRVGRTRIARHSISDARDEAISLSELFTVAECGITANIVIAVSDFFFSLQHSGCTQISHHFIIHTRRSFTFSWFNI